MDPDVISQENIEDIRIRLADIAREMRESYIDYSMSVIVARALPDVRDGLKPVHRRILYAMHELNLHYNSPYKKSAKTVGDVIGKYHPHGDVAVYDALVRMAQDFNMRYQLIDGQGNFGCFTIDTKVKLTDGRSLSFGELIEEDKKGKRNWTYAFNKETKKIEIAEIRNPRLTIKNAEIIEVELDDGSIIKCTPNHRFMMRNGSYKAAKNLKPNDSLMPLYTKLYDGKEDKNLKGYLMLFQPISNLWEFVHRLSDKWNLDNNIYEKTLGRVRHHIDINKLNNNPDNIVRMDWKKHWQLHYKLASWRHKNDSEYVKKLSLGREKYLKTHKEILSQRISEINKKNWKDPEYRKKHSAIIRDFWQNEDYRRKHNEISSNNLKKLWKNPEFNKKIKELKSEAMKNRWKDPKYKENISQQTRIVSHKLWSNAEHKKYISNLQKERTADPKWKKKQSEISKKLWKSNSYKKKFPKDHFSSMAKILWSNTKTKALHEEKIKKQRLDLNFIIKQKAGVTKSNYKRLHDNPLMMFELAQKAKSSLKLKWKDPEYKKKVMRSRIMKFTSSLLKKYSGSLTEKLFEDSRKGTNIPSVSMSIKYFDNFSDLVERSKLYNHKVKDIRFLNHREDVYDLTIDRLHNFSLDVGIFVHNSIDGDSAAAMRYTESRLQKITEEMLKDIEKETVNYIENYDGSEKEPLVLPSVLPNLLLNGADGIAVGMATKIPTHNIKEVLDALQYMIEKGNQYNGELRENKFPRFETNAEVDELMKFIKGPDFPTGGIIYNKEDIKNVYATGRGRIVMRAVAEIEDAKGGRSQIVITQLPYQVNKARLASKIADLVKAEKIVGISDIRDESNREGMRLVIEVKKEARPNNILSLLYKHTEIQTAFNANMLALVNGEPKVLTLKNILEEFITHRQEIIIRRTEYDLRKARERAHILEGYKIAIDNLDAVINTIRQSPDSEVARERLMVNFNLSQIQAQAILDLQLRRLAALEIQKIEDEYKQIMELITKLEEILATPSLVLKIISDEFAYLKENFADTRKTKVISGKVGELSDVDTIPQVETIITISKKGYIKRINPDTYKIQHRGGKGILGMKTKEEDYVTHAFVCDTHANILLFSNKGKVYQLKCYEIPEAQRTAKGTSLMNLVNLENGEIITSVLTKDNGSYKEDTENLGDPITPRNYKYLFMATKKGIVKKTKLDQYDEIRKNGVIAIVLDKNDELSWAKPTTGDDEIILVTQKAHSIRFKESDVRETGRATMGVMGIRMKSDDQLIGMDVIFDKEENIFILSENGYGKMTPLKEYSTQGRGGQGVFTAKVGVKNGDLVIGRILIKSQKEIIILSRKGQAIRIGIESVPVLGRQTKGVRLMNLPSEDKVAAITTL